MFAWMTILGKKQSQGLPLWPEDQEASVTFFLDYVTLGSVTTKEWDRKRPKMILKLYLSDWILKLDLICHGGQNLVTFLPRVFLIGHMLRIDNESRHEEA